MASPSAMLTVVVSVRFTSTLFFQYLATRLPPLKLCQPATYTSIPRTVVSFLRQPVQNITAIRMILTLNLTETNLYGMALFWSNVSFKSIPTGLTLELHLNKHSILLSLH